MTASRIKGRGALIRSLRGLVIRVGRYAQHRAQPGTEQQWAARLFDALRVTLHEADDPTVHADLARVERRARLSRKDRG